MRYGGYKSTTYALAEIIDNSVEANAKHIELMCLDNHETKTLNEIAVLDNGSGMNKEELWNALTFGEGMRRSRKGIGRFGMGLPNSSISQCKLVRVYSWKKPNEIFTTYLDLDELEKSDLQEVPEPEPSTIPEIWKKHAKHLPDSGTLVIWSKLDRCPWKKSGTVMRNSEKLIGRIYRKYLTKHKLTIRMSSFTEYENNREDYALPNDPLYLMEKTSTPAPYDTKAMFQEDGDKWEDTFAMKNHNGEKYNVTLRFSFVKPDVRKGDSPGNTDYGKHAGSNIGVSIIRADRELDLDEGLLITDQRERWWGAEVDFPPELDEEFGITNNKQDATNFSAMTKLIGAEKRRNEIVDEDLKDSPMYKLVQTINSRIESMRGLIREGREGVRSPEDEPDNPDEKFKGRQDPRHPTVTGGGRKKPEGERKKELEEEEIPPPTITDILENDKRIIFQRKKLSGYQFFDVSFTGGVAIVKLNVSHNAYKNFVGLFDEAPKTTDPKKLMALHKQIQDAIKLLLASWACYEDETVNDDRRNQISEVRYEWGKYLDYFLTKSE